MHALYVQHGGEEDFFPAITEIFNISAQQAEKECKASVQACVSSSGRSSDLVLFLEKVRSNDVGGLNSLKSRAAALLSMTTPAFFFPSQEGKKNAHYEVSSEVSHIWTEYVTRLHNNGRTIIPSFFTVEEDVISSPPNDESKVKTWVREYHTEMFLAVI
jgi:hypothetical protein